jgi:hypothetical protein
VCCMVKDKRQSQDSQDKEIRIKYRQNKNSVIGAFMSLSCECWVSPRRPITHQEKFYQLWWVTACDIKSWRIRRSWPYESCWARDRMSYICVHLPLHIHAWLINQDGSFIFKRKTKNICFFLCTYRMHTAKHRRFSAY